MKPPESLHLDACPALSRYALVEGGSPRCGAVRPAQALARLPWPGARQFHALCALWI